MKIHYFDVQFTQKPREIDNIGKKKNCRQTLHLLRDAQKFFCYHIKIELLPLPMVTNFLVKMAVLTQFNDGFPIIMKHFEG